MEPKFIVTNDRYSREPATGMLEELQACFDYMGYNVPLKSDGDCLYDGDTGEVVGEAI